MSAPEQEWHSTGSQQEIPTERLQAIEDRMDEVYAFDTLLTRPAVGCFVCEQTYEPRLRRRKCPGEPRRGLRRS